MQNQFEQESHSEAGLATCTHNRGTAFEFHKHNERRLWFVIVLTVIAMIAEIVAGKIYGSMALVADGWHMSTHAAAMLIAALAYFFARKHRRDPRFAFGTGKLGELAGFASSIILAVVAIMIGWESFLRLVNPTEINFREAMIVAILGLIINLVSAWLLGNGKHGHEHGHAHGHEHGHGHAHRHEDHNLRAAYLHVLADALTSVLAIVALLSGSVFGWVWPDPLMGAVGAVVILRWSWN